MNEIIPTKLKVFIIPYPPDYYYPYSCPRTTLFCKQGLEKIAELVEDPMVADFYLLNYVPHVGQDKYNKTFIKPYLDKNKLIVYDMQDENESYLANEDEYLVYFKRSWFDLEGKLKERPINFFPTAYGILDQFLVYPIEKHVLRPVDIGVYLRPDSPNRSKLLQIFSQIQQQNPLNMWVGPISQGNRSSQEKPTFDDKYFQMLGRTKINIHCDPSNWVGDNRFGESVSQVCLTFTNTRFDHLPNPFIDEKHIIKYDMNDIQGMINKINYYLANPAKLAEIAWAGYNHSLNWTADKIMQRVLDKAMEIKNENNN